MSKTKLNFFEKQMNLRNLSESQKSHLLGIMMDSLAVLTKQEISECIDHHLKEVPTVEVNLISSKTLQ